MKSFPSAFNRGGNSNKFTGKHAIDEDVQQLNSIGSREISELEKIQAKNLNYTTATKKYLFNQVDATKYDRYIPTTVEHSIYHTSATRDVRFENPQFIPSWVLASMNNYRAVFEKAVKHKFEAAKTDGGMVVSLSATTASPSLFNPMYMVQAVGFTPNVPLLMDYRTKEVTQHKDIGDCRIEKLIKDSATPNSLLGMARYRLVDFMYCKDLGRVSNNHLITLRKFPFPIGDHIFDKATSKYSSARYSLETPGDVGHLCAWFGTDDNKLEDICKFETQATWKEIQNKIQEIDSKENAQNRGILGKVLNAVNPAYNMYSDVTGAGGHSILADLGARIFPGVSKVNDDNERERFRQSSDNNKVWTPKNTVQDNHIYEGKLILKQEITVTFSYKLRAYEDINPKSAFLDLMGNILEVTFQRGHYWKGEARIIGSPQNRPGWQKATAIIDGAWSKLGGFIEAMAAGTIDFNNILGAVSNMVSGGISNIVNFAKSVADDPSAAGKKLIDNVKTLDSATGLSHGMKALMKNSLGRPAMYAMDSLISGDDMGLWHLTVGNPYNPIMSIGNLILTGSTVQHSGALGVDDFPTEIKVVCSLKPARSRDVTGISRYYTKGLNSLYLHTKRNYVEDFYKTAGGAGQYSSQNFDKMQKESAMLNTKDNEENQTGDVPNNTGKDITDTFHDQDTNLYGHWTQHTDENGNPKFEYVEKSAVMDSFKANESSKDWQGLGDARSQQIYQLGNTSMHQFDVAGNEVA